MSETVSLQKNNIPAGIALMLGATMVFATQDGISRHLAGEYNTYMVVMIRYWFFAVFVIAIAVSAKGVGGSWNSSWWMSAAAA